MPNCFSLTPIGEKERARFADIDDKMREHFQQPPSETEWLFHWYDIIGLHLACGRTFDEIIESTTGDLRAAAEWLKERYTANSWYQHR